MAHPAAHCPWQIQKCVFAKAVFNPRNAQFGLFFAISVQKKNNERLEVCVSEITKTLLLTHYLKVMGFGYLLSLKGPW